MHGCPFSAHNARNHGISKAGHVPFCTEENAHVGIYLNLNLLKLQAGD